MKSNKLYKFLLIFLFVNVLISCDEDGYEDYDPGETNTQDFSGEWYIVGYFDDGSVAYEEFGADYFLYSTFNTAANNQEFWIDDHDTFFQLKTKVEGNPSDLTFSGEENAPELYADETVTITNGKIIKDGGRAAGSGTVVDSIYFEAEFSWDPGTTYIFGGHSRTGFFEDEDPTIF